MKTRKNDRSCRAPAARVLRPLLCALLALAAGLTGQAHTYVQLPLIVNVLVGEGITDDTIRARVDGMNKIIGQCGNISCTLVKINHNWPDNHEPGDTPGDVRPDGRDQLRDDGEKEIAAQGASTKIFVAHGLLDGGGDNMDGVNGVTVIGRPVSIIADGNGDDRTWAHEFAHQMGLDHNNVPGNLMEDPRPLGAGTALTEDQCATLLANILLHGPIVEKTIDQMTDPYRYGWTATVSAADAWTASTPATYVRSLGHSFELTATSATMVVNLRLAGVIPTGVGAQYNVAYDTDQNTATGQPVAGYLGMDRLLQLSVSGVFAAAQVMDLQHNQFLGTLPAQVIRLSEHTEATSSHTPLDVADSIQLTVPLSMMGTLSNPSLALASSSSSLGNNTLPPAPIATALPQRPPVTLAPLAAYPQQPVAITAQGFTPVSTAEVRINHQLVQTNTTDSNGAFSASVPTPLLVPGDYFLDVVDAQGKLNMKVLRVLGVTLTAQRSGAGLNLAWPVLAGTNTLQQSASLHAPDWQTVATPPVVSGSNFVVTVSAGAEPGYYRLRLGPSQ